MWSGGHLKQHDIAHGVLHAMCSLGQAFINFFYYSKALYITDMISWEAHDKYCMISKEKIKPTILRTSSSLELLIVFSVEGFLEIVYKTVYRNI